MTITPPRESQRRYHYMTLQTGSLPLCPDGTMERSKEHRCSSVLLWPEATHPTAENVILIDPSFTMSGIREAEHHLQRLDISFGEIEHLVVTHRHGDHLPSFPFHRKSLHAQTQQPFSCPGISLIPCPGHASDLHALTCFSTDSEYVWIVGDAILNIEWLRAWGYYWPNQYSSVEIVQTWKSLANILSQADVVIPGHGEQIFVTAPLIEELMSSFPSAEHAEECPEVHTILANRLKQLRAAKSKDHAEASDKNQ